MIAIGLMSGTSLDGVDAALLDTDGETITRFGPGCETPFEPSERAVLKAAVEAALVWRFEGAEPAIFREAERVLTDTHARAVKQVAKMANLAITDVELVGFHGQTVVHHPPKDGRNGQTRQLGDGQALADRLGVPVAYDFRTLDMAAGGQGAPLAPIYHQVLARWAGLEHPLGVLNIGGVANLTLIRSDGTLDAFDTGPGNGLIDAWVEERTGQPMDRDGALASQGRVLEAGLAELLAHPHFALEGPKSLDRWDFSLDAARNLSVEDGAATLSQFTAEAIGLGLKACRECPKRLIVCGGGRKNADLLRRISVATGISVCSGEAVGWRGDLIEAEAFAVLAARTQRGLPLSFPGTTGVAAPQNGGQIAHPA